MQVHVRVCQECGQEYRPDIESCADCGGELRDVYDDEGGTTPVSIPEPEESVDLTNHRSLFQTANARTLVPLAERLQERGIAFHMVEQGLGTAATARFDLLVHENDAKSSLEALADILAPDTDGGAVHALESHYESGRYVKCPACGAEQGSGLAECTECGLALGVSVPTCERCGTPLEEEGEECSTCGGTPPTG